MIPNAKSLYFGCLAGAMVIVILLYLHTTRKPIPRYTPRCNCDTTNIQRNLKKELQEFHGELVSLTAQNKLPSTKLLKHMEEILHRLDNVKPEVNSNSSDIYGTQPPNTDPKAITGTHPSTKNPNAITGTRLPDKHPKALNGTTMLDVCPEVFKGSKGGGYPYFATGWDMIKCTNALPIKSVITILINAVAYSKEDFKQLNFVLNGITKAYPTVDVYLAAQSGEQSKELKQYRGVNLVNFTNSERPNLGKIWNILINKASTPYILIARDVVHFSWLSRLERQIRVVSEIPNVGIAGGSFRNLSGHWKVGCYQSSMKNYVLEYQEGYFHSRNECMFCDYLQGPFVAKKSLLKPFDEDLSNEVIFEDLFLRLTSSGILVMGCPDAMYFTTDYSSYPKRNQRQAWQAFAKKWVLNRVFLPGGVKHSFSCNDIGFSCSSRLARSHLLPVCCQEQYANIVTFLQAFANKHNIPFELDTGSVLGTVKFNGLMPWDLDGDGTMLSKDIKIFGERKTVEYFKEHGFSVQGYEQPLSVRKKGYVKIKQGAVYFELSGMPLITNPQYLPDDLKNRFTLVQVRDSWISSVFSPGLFARNRYGVEVLKHSQSWILYGQKTSHINYTTQGSWIKGTCTKPMHSCLQNFPADGNIPFLVS